MTKQASVLTLNIDTELSETSFATTVGVMERQNVHLYVVKVNISDMSLRMVDVELVRLTQCSLQISPP